MQLGCLKYQNYIRTFTNVLKYINHAIKKRKKSNYVIHSCKYMYSILVNCAIYIFFVLMLMLCHSETHIKHTYKTDRTRKLLRPMWVWTIRRSEWGNIPCCQLSRMVLSYDRDNTKNRQFQWLGQRGTGQLTARLRWSLVNFNTWVSRALYVYIIYIYIS